MKFVFSFLFILSFALTVQADPGPAYIFKVEVSYDKGKATGYIYMGGIYDDEKQFAKSDTTFARVIKQWNGEDSLYLFQEMYFIDSLDMHIFFKDKLLKIDERKIVNIHMKKIIPAFVGNWVNEDRFETKDIAWLKKAYIRKEEYGDFYCGYDLYYFEKVPPNEEFLKISKEYANIVSERELEKWSVILHKYFNTLKKYKVVIRAQCSC